MLVGVLEVFIAPSCNGWTFWHYERSGGLTQIDELRRIARLGMERAGA